MRKTFVSWDRDEADREWACLTVLAEHAPGVAPRPLRREIGAGGAPVVVMERLPGVPLGAALLTVAQTGALGSTLRRMYDVPLAVVGSAGIGGRRFGPTRHAATVASWLSAAYDASMLHDPALVAEAASAALAWLARDDVRPEPVLDSLGIADLNPANVLWDGEVCRLVDFEDGGLSDRAYELADHVEHLGGRLTGVYSPAALVDAVGLTEAEQTRMTAYRPLWAAFWLAMLLPGNGGFDRNPPGTTEAQARHVMGLLER